MNKFLISFVLFLSFFSISLHAKNSTYVACVPELQQCLKKIQMLPEGRELIMKIQQEGPIRIGLARTQLSSEFGAFWDPDRRMICLNPSWHGSEGEMIASILFEMHNALVSSKMEKLNYLAECGQISRDKYVESFERLEYENSVNASRIAKKGIQMGIFPPSSKMHVYKDFEEHFHYQIISGHSRWIARNFDNLCS